MKINFTKEHFSKLCDLAMQMLFDNEVVTTRMGQNLNIVELLHTTTINTLNNIRIDFVKQIERLENKDEWVSDSQSQESLEKAKRGKELVNLIIGYKRYMLELEIQRAKKAELTDKLNQLKESQKTPEDKIKELEAELAGMENPEF